MMNSEDEIRRALAGVRDPETGGNVMESGRVSGIVLRGGEVGFILEIDPGQAGEAGPLGQRCEAAVRAVPGVESVRMVVTNRPGPAGVQNPATARPAVAAQWRSDPVPGVARVVAVASGKGGVGKSTVTAALARAMQANGQRVGILDADIYGPSLPHLTGLAGAPDLAEDGRLKPKDWNGISVMSVGFIAPEGPVVWRGPMLVKALNQMLRRTAWEELDLLLVDMPPGTGDVHLTMAQQTPLDGAVLVTTPPEIAAIDAKKCAQMFRKVHVPLLGVVENMSWLEMPGGSRITPFGAGGGAALAEMFDLPLLAQLPLAEGDEGGEPDTLLDALAKRLAGIEMIG